MFGRLLLFITSLMVLLVVVPVSTAQATSPWYAVIYQPETDTLAWVNASGQQSSVPRPTLPNEAEFRDLRISPNGRTMVIVSQRIDGLEQLGVYDFAAGGFVQTHLSQPGEQIHLGSKNIFSANSQFFAVGLFSGDFSNPAWRVILFEAVSGNAAAFIDHTHPDAPDAPLSAPSVQYLDSTAVHFQLIPQAVGGTAVWPAYAWQAFGFNPVGPAIAESGYNRANMDILLLTGEIATAYKDETFPAAPLDGQTPDFNAVGRGFPSLAASLTTAHVDSTRFHLTARWANGGQWILFYSTDAMNNDYWNAILADGAPGNNGHMPFDPGIIQVIGTSDGYLALNDTRLLSFTSGFMANTAQPILQLSAADRVMYVTPIGVTFTLAQLPGAAAQALTPTPIIPAAVVTPAVPDVVTPQAPPPAPVDCSQALPPRVNIGVQARVIPAAGSLNLRQQPNGAIITALAGGDEFTVVGGFVCDNGLHWWQIDRFGTVGWVAESTFTEYFIEPYIPPPPMPPGPGNEGVPVEAGCEQAPASRLSAGSNATVVQDQLRPHISPNGEIIPQRFLMSGTSVSVTAGPECAGGYRWWLVLGQARVGRIGQQMEPVQGWVSEGQDGTYNLEP